MAPTALESAKASSRYLRGTLADELAASDLGHFTAEAGQMLKFHGIYQQDDRDQRRERTRREEDLAYSCMVRCAVPGGVLRRDQWLAIDRLADTVGDGGLRLTSRQGVQYHFVHKGGLRHLVAELNRGLVTTYAACGDVVRNVMVSSAPYRDRDLERLESLARALVGRFRPRSGAYWELWLDGERAVSSGPSAPDGGRDGGDPVEPIYGAAYLPRKFKIGIAWPGDNSIDVFSQDLGLVPIAGTDGSDGAVVLVGGGLGRSHKDPSTHPRLAEPLAWVPDVQLADLAEAVVTTFRDHGNREDRSHARLKYLIEERGLAWFRQEIEARLGSELAPPVPLPAWSRTRHHLGWHQQSNGRDGEERWFLGIPVPSGRLAAGGGGGGGEEEVRGGSFRAAVRRVLETHADEVRLTPTQDLLLCGIRAEHREAVEAIVASHRVPLAAELPLTVISSMACPALPTCGQALGEAERVLPEVTGLIGQLLQDRGLQEVAIETRMTGCPNGCSRPYVAELGIVGRTKTAYDLWVGGDPAGTRLAWPLIESVPLAKLGDVAAILLDRFRAERDRDEGFGAWADRVGAAALAAGLPSFARSPRTSTEDR
jgi:sulfite reductase (ferredoxin)